jgi:hypothetical protein
VKKSKAPRFRCEAGRFFFYSPRGGSAGSGANLPKTGKTQKNAKNFFKNIEILCVSTRTIEI